MHIKVHLCILVHQIEGKLMQEPEGRANIRFEGKLYLLMLIEAEKRKWSMSTLVREAVKAFLEAK